MHSSYRYARADDLIESAVAHGALGTLCRALDAADLTHMLKGSGPYTLFAPTDAAFDKLPAGTLERLMQPEHRAELVAMLKYHLLPGRSFSEDIPDMTRARMMQGDSIRIERDGERCTVNGAHFVGAEITAGNGIIHAIDAVIEPPRDDRRQR